MKKTYLIYLFLISFSIQHIQAVETGEKSRHFHESITAPACHKAILEFHQNQKWNELIEECLLLMNYFPTSPFSKEANYYLGVAYFNLYDNQLANEFFSKYLSEEMAPKFFEEVIHNKFEIASRFEGGAKKHIFGWKKMPSWVSAYDTAIEIYDEVITTLPRDDLAAKSLFQKGVLLSNMEEYKKSVEAFQTLIRRFPKHSLAPEGYLGIAAIYLKRCEKEFPDSDLLDLAEINMRKFRFHFPLEPRQEKAELMLLNMKEKLAKDLFEIGEFYQRTKKKKAASLYFATIMKKYPETNAAKQSQKRLDKLGISEKDIFQNKQKMDHSLVVENSPTENLH